MNERDLFVAALHITDPVARSAWLDRACGGDAALRQRVEELLKALGEVGSLLENSVVPLQATVGQTRADAAGDSSCTAERLYRAEMMLGGRFKLLEEIGEGGMGTVWLAQQTEPVKRLVAVKLIKAGMDSKQV